MAISINWATGVITIPQSYLTVISGSLYSLDVNAFRLSLKDLEDDEAGIVWPNTHAHATEKTLSGVTYARQVEILSPYTITFQDVGTPYTVKCAGANHNIGDVKNVNQVSLIIGNSAGLITVTSGSGVTAQDKTDIVNAVWTRALEGSLTAEQMQRLLLSALAGKVSGAGTGAEAFRDMADSKDRLTVTVDANGNRTAVVRDAT